MRLPPFSERRNEPFKIELIADIPDEQVSIYENDGFADLCAAPHVPSTGFLKHFKLLSVAGAYWRGDERNPVMQRIYGVSFPKAEFLDQHLHMLEEAQKRDHRRLGRKLDLFSFQPEGPGFPFWHPNGVLLVNTVTKAVRDILDRNGYLEIKTPVILSEDLWHRRGTGIIQGKNMYFTAIDENSLCRGNP